MLLSNFCMIVIKKNAFLYEFLALPNFIPKRERRDKHGRQEAVGIVDHFIWGCGFGGNVWPQEVDA